MGRPLGPGGFLQVLKYWNKNNMNTGRVRPRTSTSDIAVIYELYN